MKLFIFAALLAAANAGDASCMGVKDYKCISGTDYCVNGEDMKCPRSASFCENSNDQMNCRNSPCKGRSEAGLSSFVKALYSHYKQVDKFAHRLRADTIRCRKRNWICSDDEGFCLDNIYMECSPGTKCLNTQEQKDCNWSPCIEA